MQQTEKYALNLIETSDPFSPAALNENAQKTEAALAALSGADAALDSRVMVLEGRKIAAGQYTGTGAKSPQTFNLGFTPIAVLVCYANCYTGGATIALQGYYAYDDREDSPAVSIIPGGFQIGNSTGSYCHYNQSGYKFNYLAFA